MHQVFSSLMEKQQLFWKFQSQTTELVESESESKLKIPFLFIKAYSNLMHWVFNMSHPN